MLWLKCSDWNSGICRSLCLRANGHTVQLKTFQPKLEWKFLRVGLHTWIVQEAQAKPLNKSVALWSKGMTGEVAPHPSVPPFIMGVCNPLWHRAENPPGILSILVIVQSQTQSKQASIGWWSDQYLQWKISYKITHYIVYTVLVLWQDWLALRKAVADMR